MIFNDQFSISTHIHSPSFQHEYVLIVIKLGLILILEVLGAVWETSGQIQISNSKS